MTIAESWAILTATILKCDYLSDYLKGGGHAKILLFFISLLNSTKDVKRAVKK